MSSVAKRAGLAVLALAVVAVVVAVELLRRGGQFRTVEPVFGGTCRSISMQASAEDIRIDHGTGLAYLAYLEGRPGSADRRHGTVMLVDLNVKQPHVRAALTTEPADFRPSGISLYAPLIGTRKLFVISRQPSGPHRIEIFEQIPTGAFAPVKTLSHPLLTSPSAILAVGPRQFYVVNESGALTRFQRFQEAWLRKGFSTLLYYDGQATHVVARGLRSPRGLAGSRDRHSVYVSDTKGRALMIFVHNSTTGALRRAETVPLDSEPENISVDEHGNLWIAAQPKPLALMRHLRDPSVRAPTQVFRFTPGSEEQEAPTEIFSDPGDQLSAGSVAAVHDGRMLLGSLTEPKLLDCTLPSAHGVAHAD